MAWILIVVCAGLLALACGALILWSRVITLREQAHVQEQRLDEVVRQLGSRWVPVKPRDVPWE